MRSLILCIGMLCCGIGATTYAYEEPQDSENGYDDADWPPTDDGAHPATAGVGVEVSVQDMVAAEEIAVPMHRQVHFSPQHTAQCFRFSNSETTSWIFKTASERGKCAIDTVL